MSSNQLIQVLDEYFDSKLDDLEHHNKVIDLSKRDIINYEEPIIQMKRSKVNTSNCSIISIYHRNSIHDS